MKTIALKDIDDKIKISYESDEDNILEDFYIKVISNSVYYRRLTGPFSSTILAGASRGISRFIKNDGKMELVCWAILSKDDANAIKKGEKKPNEVISEFITRNLKIKEIKDKLEKDYLKALSWMIANGNLDIKIAVKKDENGNYKPSLKDTIGEFHRKSGLLRDDNGDEICFTGSGNESISGWKYNIEGLQVFKSWKNEDKKRFKKQKQRIKKYWENNANKVEIFEFPEAMEEKLIEFAPTLKDDIISLELERRLLQKIKKKKSKTKKDKWRHQKEAERKFIENKKGILQMATGTGKSRTAINIMNHLYEENEIDGAIITTYGTDLLDQWVDKLYERANENLMIYQHFGDEHGKSDFIMDPTSSILVISKYFLPKILNEILPSKRDIIKNKLLIMDEIHMMGSKKIRKKLDEKLEDLPYKLGLSATPEREYDEKGNKFIKNQIGPVIYEFGLEKAIKRGILSEFDYVPLYYRLSEEDKQKKQAAFARYESSKKKNPSVSKKNLYIDLAKVKKLSEEKLPILENYLSENPSVLNNCIIFVETKSYGKKVQQIILNFKDDFHTYYGGDEKENLNKFARGEIKCLITCKKISQGIDIQSIENIILLSSPRALLTTIQRIGRALRIDPSNPSKVAKVIDFLEKSEIEEPNKNDEKLTADFIRYNFLKELSQVATKEENR